MEAEKTHREEPGGINRLERRRRSYRKRWRMMRRKWRIMRRRKRGGG